MKFSKFQIAILLGIFVVGIIAYIDTLGVHILGWEDYTNGNFPIDYWFSFRNIALILMILVPICYYFFFRKDKSETLAIFFTSFILWMFGVADLFYFWLQGKAIPSQLPWLNNHPIIGLFGPVTNSSLYMSIIIGGVITYFIVKQLKKI